MANEQFIQALQASQEIELTVTGRKSGREITYSVWFVQEGDRLYLVPVNGSDSDWFRNVLRSWRSAWPLGVRRSTASAKPITDPAAVGQVVDKFRVKYGIGNVKRYYPKKNVAVEVPLT